MKHTLEKATAESVKILIPAGENSNQQLDRESKGCGSVVFFSSVFIGLDLFKQISSYGVKAYNGDHYPIPQTAIVLLTELLKLSVAFSFLIVQGGFRTLSISGWYAVPALIAAVNNNVYYLALHYTTPPMWNILLQMRLIFTGLTYRFVFKKTVTGAQWFALFLLIAAIATTKMLGGRDDETNFVKPTAIVLAVLGSATSVGGMVYAEYLFKNDNKSFAEKQTQMYLFGSLGSMVLYIIQTRSLALPAIEIKNEFEANTDRIWVLLLMCIVFSSGIGLSTAVIMKKLDNIVKLYTQALSNMLTSLACTMLFPNDFHVNFTFVICLVIVIVAISLYEKKTVDMDGTIWARIMDYISQKKVVVVIVLVVVALPVVPYITYQFSKSAPSTPGPH